VVCLWLFHCGNEYSNNSFLKWQGVVQRKVAAFGNIHNCFFRFLYQISQFDFFLLHILGYTATLLPSIYRTFVNIECGFFTEQMAIEPQGKQSLEPELRKMTGLTLLKHNVKTRALSKC
jgi:hypothetical protein